jgi:hypothetical protein
MLMQFLIGVAVGQGEMHLVLSVKPEGHVAVGVARGTQLLVGVEVQ